MGGCKCTYRNCSVRSDGKTHMFHYPVFDKVRCHQWLTNAQRSDFLNLKVSQLKNRVVCQHHFKPSYFMNFKMDKLTFDAVPTENGPFCEGENQDPAMYDKVFTITPDDIENDRLSFNEKIATFPVKYGDFLINSEMDPSTRVDFNLPSEIKKTENFTVTILPDGNIGKDNTCKTVMDTNILKYESPTGGKKIKNETKKKKIEILSEKKIFSPVKLKGELKPVPANVIISVRGNNNVPQAIPTDKFDDMDVIICNPEKSQDQQMELQNKVSSSTFIQSEVINSNPVNLHEEINNIVTSSDISCGNVKDVIEIEMIPIDVKDTKVSPPKEVLNKNKSLTPSKSFLKYKIPPERVAAIEDKRNFNKKLRDMIEICLDGSNVKGKNFIDDKLTNNKTCELRPCTEEVDSTQTRNNETHIIAQKVIEQSNLTDSRKYDFASLEKKMETMQELLLRKIEENSKKIGDLKKTVVSSVDKRSVFTQTVSESEEIRKKRLFQDMSEYLGPELNSLIYEQLFLNKYIQSKPEAHTIKRRKCR